MRERRVANSDLSGGDLFGMDLSNCRFDNVRMPAANLCGSTLAGTFFQNCALGGARLAQANLKGSRFVQVYMQGAVLNSVSAEEVSWSGVNLTRAKAYGADFSQSTFDDCVWADAHFAGSRLFKVHLDRCVLSNANLSGADLTIGKLCRITAPRVKVVAVSAGIQFNNLRTSFLDLRGVMGNVITVTQSMTSTVGRLVQNAIDSFRWIENLDESRADRMRLQVAERQGQY